METRPTVLTVLLALVVVLSGCAGLGGDGSDGGGVPEQELSSDGGGGGDAPAGAASADGQAQTDDSTQRQTEREIIRTGMVELRVEDFDATRAHLRQRVQAMGGYVGGSGETRHSQDDTNWSSGYLVVRVPAERFSNMLSVAREQGVVRSEETSTEDVTDRLVDLEARMTNLEERRTRLRSFYDRANSTEELLRVEERLSDVQGEIERLEAERRSLENQVSYATLRIELSERPETGPSATTDRSLGSAFFDSVATLVDLGQWSVLFLAGTVPYLVVFGLPAVFLYRLLRRDRLWPRLGGVGSRSESESADTDGEDTTETEQ